MSDRHFEFWPAHLARTMMIPETHLFFNIEVSAARYPRKPCQIFYDSPITFARFKDEAERIAGFLQRECGVAKGDRVILLMQNSPQFALAYYGILRADAVVVPLSPMNITRELRQYVDDSGARTALVAQELYPQIAPLVGDGIAHVVVAAYSDYLTEPTDMAVPDVISAPAQPVAGAGVASWSDVLTRDLRPRPMEVGPDSPAVLPYTSGTTGRPKGCVHTHRSAMHTIVAGAQWFRLTPGAVHLAVAPFFHVTGMQGSLNTPIYNGSTSVLLPRWDRDAAARYIERYRVNAWSAVPSMIIDFLSNPRLGQYDISSLSRMTGGGAAMPEAIAQRMLDRGITYVEGYGLTETIAPTHINPPDRPKKQCLGIPIFDTEARVVDPADFHELPPGQVGELVISGPQVFREYWKQPEATAEAFVELDGKRFFRTGDLAKTDEDGYFFMVDRLKRMINAGGYKVWPAEVESLMYAHPAIAEACVIGARDPRRGETVKALVVLKEAARGEVTAADIIEWSKQRMAVYKYPRVVDFVDALPRSGTGKIDWRKLQEIENARS